MNSKKFKGGSSNNNKSESIPLIENNEQERQHYETSDNNQSDFSSSSIHYSTDYGTEYRNRQHKSKRNSFGNLIESMSDRYLSYNQILNGSFNEFSGQSKNLTVSWDNINCFAAELGKGAFGRVKETGLYKQLLFDISGIVKTGRMTAIMGASGAGKSTLLNVITCRNLGNLRVDGEVRVNGSIMHSTIKSISAYVQQLDVFWGRLKVREHLIYNAVLRMGKKFTKDQKIARVNQLIQEMGLSQVEYDFINTSSKVQGLAGSEKKLLSISCELLVDPPIIFLDEPTTGLDAHMAEKVVKKLQNLALKQNKCILCTIHQPASHIFEMFNETILLAEGRLIFQGARDNALDFFSDIGFPCSENYNPADHFIHTLAIRPNREADCRSKVIYMARKFRDTSEYGYLRKELNNIKNTDNQSIKSSIPSNSRDDITNTRIFKASYRQEIGILTWKQFLDQVREPKLFAARIIQNIIVVIILSSFYFQQQYNQTSINNISGVMFNVITSTTFLAVIQLNSFVTEVIFFYKEHESGMARPLSFFLSKNLSEIPIFLITTSSLIFITYWCVGLYNNWLEFIVFYCVIILVYQYSFSLNVLFVGSLFNNTDIVLNIAPLIRIVMMYMGGFLINEKSIPVYMRWLQYLSWHRYAFEILVVNQWQKVDHISCKTSYNVTLTDAACLKDGYDVIAYLGFSANAILFDLLMLIGLGIVFRFLGLCVILWRSRERKLN